MIGDATHLRGSLTIVGPRSDRTASVTVPLTDTLVIGRHPSCGVVLADITVSRRHVELRRVGDEIVLTDLGSLNGTYVNQLPVERVALADGDTILIGDYRMHFRSPRTTDRDQPVRMARAS